MANEVLQKIGTAVVWADTTDYTPGTSKPARTDQIDLTSLPNGSWRQGAKADLGATHASEMRLEADIEFDVVPTAGNEVRIYLAWSDDATAADRNPGNASGSDGAYTGYNANPDESAVQMDGPYVFTCSASASAPDDQLQDLGIVRVLGRYVSPVLDNDSGQAFEGDAAEMYIALYPLIPEIQ